VLQHQTLISTKNSYIKEIIGERSIRAKNKKRMERRRLTLIRIML
jgi:hypothetical protein